jgi:hemin uptake protein HemP
MNTSGDKDGPSNSGAGQNASASQRQISLVLNRIASRDLFVGTREITIAHGDEVYRLRLTAQNKLILTK